MVVSLSGHLTDLCFPPPVTCPHLVVSSVPTIFIRVSFFRSICHVIAKSRISNEFPNTFNGIANPKLVFFDYRLIVFIEKLSHSLYHFTRPLRTSRELVHFLLV